MKIGHMDVTKFHAICHLIGEWSSLSRTTVDTAKIQAFCGVTKPTVLKYLNLMQSYGYVSLTSRKWRTNAYAYSWSLTPKAARAYESGDYKNHYDFYSALIIQAASNPKRGTMVI